MGKAKETESAAARVTFRDVFGVREYRALWLSQLLSLIGDQLAIVALTWLVFEASDSALLAAVAYSIAYVPWLIGGPFLSGLADRLPRREIMVWCDVVRAALVLLIAVPGMPLWAMCVLLFAAEMLSPLFSAARAALLPEILPGDRYVLGTAIGNMTQQLGQLAGFGLAGVLVAAVDPPVALVLDAATFVVSGALVGLVLHYRPPAREERAAVGLLLSDMIAGTRLIFGRRDLALLTAFGMLAVFLVVPEGLAVPYAAELGGGAAAAGLLLAAGPLGGVVGALLFSRFVSPARRLRLMGPLAVASSVILVGCAVQPGLPWSVVVFAASGAGGAYQLAANAAFVEGVAPDARAQAFGLVQALMCLGQGGTIVVAGAVAEQWRPSSTIALAGGIGCLAAAVLAASWRRVSPRAPAVVPRPR